MVGEGSSVRTQPSPGTGSKFQDLLYLPLRLPVGLWMVTRGETYGHIQEGEGLPDAGNELGSSVGHYVLWDAEIPEHLVE